MDPPAPNPAARQSASAQSSAQSSAQVARFCHQYLQFDSGLDFPDGELLRNAATQDILYDWLFADQAVIPPLHPRYRLRVLKELIARIEAAIVDWDEHGISDDLMAALSSLMSMPLPSQTDAAQQKCYVQYHLSLLGPGGDPALRLTDPHITLLESRALISAAGTTGLRTWEASLHLGQHLCANPGLVRGRRVLELGAGTGYLAVLCAKHLGAEHVIASDGSDDVLNHLPDTLFLNGLQGSDRVSAMELRWGHGLLGTEEPAWNGGRAVDVVLGADITYDARSHPALVATLEELVGLFPDAVVIIAATERGRTTFESFLRTYTAKMADSDSPVTLRTRKFIRNPLLGRKQMVVDILHPNRANISKEELREKLAGVYKANKEQVSVFGLRTQFGGGKTTGFALVYDSPEAMKKFEPQYRLIRVGLATKAERASRQQRKQRKNRQKTLRGTAKVKGAKAKKDK
ncbi:S-adenosylmethionine-dependent methyltransferase-like protein [Lasiosphaeris hirsuta]|uniref:40S ribosomal protein S24 n=1 Tax=Lasiosphaeris hirsuta TaxID=260670 RepID=A0AA40E148_9PEZI|nr:S-adenosylmethionine-dependent methyltransferase-like protein [Lasiosphaeris hirsuta]